MLGAPHVDGLGGAACVACTGGGAACVVYTTGGAATYVFVTGADDFGGVLVTVVAGLEGNVTTADDDATTDGDGDVADNAASLAGAVVDAQAVKITTSGAANAMIKRRRLNADTQPSGGCGQYDGGLNFMSPPLANTHSA